MVYYVDSSVMHHLLQGTNNLRSVQKCRYNDCETIKDFMVIFNVYRIYQKLLIE